MQQRSPIAQTLLSFFVPIYILYWFYVTAADMRQRGGNPPPIRLIFIPLLGLIALVFTSTLMRIGSSGESSTVFNIISILLGLALIIAVFVLPLYYFYKFSQAAEVATSRKISTTISFVLLLFISPVAVYVIQDAMNSNSALQSESGAPVAPVESAAPVNVPPTTPQA